MKNYVLRVVKDVPDCISTRVMLHRLGIDATFKTRQQTLCQGLKPGSGVAKVNCGGSVSALDFGFGGTIRDHEGKVLFVYCGNDKGRSILLHELKAIEAGLEGCILYSTLKRVQVNSDCTLAVHIVTGGSEPTWYHLNIVKSIRMKSETFEKKDVKPFLKHLKPWPDTSRPPESMATHIM
ncbi:hypothetical protein IFM89_031587 [Coptis chinensis]|uniref:RNase H type-1 domain-containing protein n=1 Tax=Coptis chinensis TaxID=261450 RepID=A0A835HZ80_9MAGN|nr:hypothetical protein IFM89_031587 [Coptis chinensis]